jgi:diacylglycerol kinase (ATP)
VPKPGRKGIARVLYATRYSWLGLKAAFRKEAAFRQELVLALILAPIGIWLGRSGVERALLVGSLLLVLIVELLNSGLEAVVDRFGEEWNKLSGRAKDMGSAAVFVALANVVSTWLLVLWDRFF